MDLNAMHICQRCNVPYHWQRSTSSSLKMTYCSSLCEQGDLGFTIEALLKADLTPPKAPAIASTELLAA